MQRGNNQLVLQKDDFEIIMTYLKGASGRSTFDRRNAEELEAELKKAKLVNKEELPADVVRLNSKVTIKDEKNKMMEVMLVLPEKADIKQKMISILSPVGTALIGFRKGQRVKWNVPSGRKTFTIVDITHPYQGA